VPPNIASAGAELHHLPRQEFEASSATIAKKTAVLAQEAFLHGSAKRLGDLNKENASATASLTASRASSVETVPIGNVTSYFFSTVKYLLVLESPLIFFSIDFYLAATDVEKQCMDTDKQPCDRTIELSDFLEMNPHDLGPVAFLKTYAPSKSSRMRDLWNLSYISLFTQALKSQDSKIYGIGQEMKTRWDADLLEVAKYWEENEPEDTHVCALLRDYKLVWVKLLSC